NTWILWTAGNQVFWDRIAREGYGLVDLLKTLDSRKRPRRFAEAGLINEPTFRMAEKPDAFGLWLDVRAESPPAGIDEKIYGRSSGVIGFRIYPNPAFDAAARRRWDPQRYYTDRDYFTDPRLVRPYRVGVTCGLAARLEQAGDERIAGEEQLLAGGAASKVPHILKDGADSVGLAGAAIRVYVNEGLYSQQWLTDHDILIGLRRQRPFSVTNA